MDLVTEVVVVSREVVIEVGGERREEEEVIGADAAGEALEEVESLVSEVVRRL